MAAGAEKTNHELLAKLFAEIDTDNSGVLDREEIGKLAAQLGASLAPDELDDAMAQVKVPPWLCQCQCAGILSPSVFMSQCSCLVAGADGC